MRKIFTILFLFTAILFLSACSKNDPQVALDKTTEELQEALEAKDIDQVLDMLHENFTAQAPENDKEWARRTMAAVFLRYKNIKIVAVNLNSHIDKQIPIRATGEGEVMLVGADGLIPDDARHYRIQLEWREEGKKWKLIQLKWQ
ncbi:MAG: nuclear transport factor 2 family protein [Burkholderiales bacterium]|jgi:hypothetical protein|nr:nuclear transport factor 2 family protein [Burkholderiales bacterium]